MEEKLSVGYVDGERDEARTRKRVGKFDAQVKKGVRDMKVQRYTLYCVHLLLCTPCAVYNLHCANPDTVYTLYSVQLILCTPSTVYTFYCVHLLLCTPCTVHTLYCVHLLLCTPCTVYTL